MTAGEVLVLLAAVLLSSALVWYFVGCRPGARRAEVTGRAHHHAERTNAVVRPSFAGSSALRAYEKTVVRRARCMVVVAIGLFGVLAVPSTAWAHGGGETEEGYLLVQQALGHLAHDTTVAGIDLATEKVDDTLATEDQEGVDVSEVEGAKTALAAGQVDAARGLLQDSIKEALANQPAATGNQTGTTLVVPELPGRSGIGGQGWGLMVVSFALLLLGVGLAFRFRPQDSVGDLRRTLAPIGAGHVPAQEPGDDEAGRS